MNRKILLQTFIAVIIAMAALQPAAQGQTTSTTVVDDFIKEDENRFYAGLEFILGAGLHPWNITLGYRRAEVIGDEIEGMDLSFAWRLGPWRFDYTLLKEFKGKTDRQKEFGLGYSPDEDGMIVNLSAQGDGKNLALRYMGGIGPGLSLNLNSIAAYRHSERKQPRE